MSRNAREGRFIGRWQGKSVRTAHRLFAGLGVNADVAWAVMSKRARRPLPVRRPRYVAPARDELDDLLASLSESDRAAINDVRAEIAAMTQNELFELVRVVMVPVSGRGVVMMAVPRSQPSCSGW